MRSEKPLSAAKPTFAIFVALLLASAIVPTQAQAQKFKVLHTFDGKDGAIPDGLLARDPAGNLYGTTSGLVRQLFPGLRHGVQVECRRQAALVA